MNIRLKKITIASVKAHFVKNQKTYYQVWVVVGPIGGIVLGSVLLPCITLSAAGSRLSAGSSFWKNFR